MSDYLTLDEAAEFLSTSKPTLYRWLRDGRIPGHKLGRQWRFLQSELETFRSGGPSDGRAEAEALIWEAIDAGANAVHLIPVGGAHSLRYRRDGGLEPVRDLDGDTFDALDRAWTAASRPVRGQEKRRLFLEREGERLQVRYRRLETFSGSRVTLRFVRESKMRLTLDGIAPEPADRAVLESLTGASHGLVLVSGRGGSGKTTTAYCCLNELAASGSRTVFTIEDEVGVYLPGVDQLEVDLDDPAAVRGAFSAVMDSDPDVLFVSSMVAQRHRGTIWGLALDAAENGHLVFVQLDAASPQHAIEQVTEAVDRPLDPILVGALWQRLERKPESGRRAVYQVEQGPLAR
ncbi:MAG: Flp pilus assembly complex ATPase component [Proteobacteria bacterium]|nr:Flp pilus assembly complex ATPase component [Pseudomonadota bacterium]